MPEQIDHQELAVSRLSTQYKNSLNLIASIRAYVSEANNLEEVFQSLLNDRWIDTATGFTLEVIGTIVGQSKILIDANNIEYFGFDGDAQSNSFGTLGDPTIGGRFRSIGESTTGFRELSEEEFRIFIRGKILKNNTTGTIDEIINQIKTLFPEIETVFIREDHGSNWEQLGNTLTIGTVDKTSITTLTSTQIAFFDTGNDQVRTYSWDGTDWSQVGNSLTYTQSAGSVKISALNSTTIASAEDNGSEAILYYFEWDGTDWTAGTSGTDLVPDGDVPNIATLDNITIAFIDNGNDELRTYERIGGLSGAWGQIGNGLNIGPLTNAPDYFVKLSDNSVAFLNSDNDTLTAYTWDGTNWSQLGNSLQDDNFVLVDGMSFFSDFIITIIYSNGVLNFIEFDGANFNFIESFQTGVTINEGSMTTLDNKNIAFVSDTNGDLITLNSPIFRNPASYEVSFDRELDNTTRVLIGNTDLIIKPIGVNVDYLFNKQWVNTLSQEFGNLIVPDMSLLSGNTIVACDRNNDTIWILKLIGDTWVIDTTVSLENRLFSYELEALDSNNFVINFINSKGQLGNSLLDEINFSTATITSLDSTTIALAGPQAGLETYSWNGTDWTQVGNTLGGVVFNGPITSLDSSTIAIERNFSGDTFLETYSWDGTDWTQVGNSLIIPEQARDLGTLDSSTIVLIDDVTGDIITYSWNGTNWVQVGNSFPADASNGAITGLSSNEIAIKNNENRLIRYFWDGTDFSQVGNDLQILGLINANLTNIDSSNVLIIDDGFDEIRNYYFDGVDWNAEINAISIPSISTKIISMLNGGSLALIDQGAEELRTYQYSINSFQMYNYDGSSISKVGDLFPNEKTGFQFLRGIGRLSSNRIASITTTGTLNTLEFNGLRWSIIGGTHNFTNNGNRSITTIDNNVIAICARTTDLSNFEDALVTFRWINNTWEQVGNSFSLNLGNPRISTLQTNMIILTDGLNNNLDVYLWDGLNWNKTWDTLAVNTGNKGLVSLDPETVVVMDDSGVTDQINNYRLEGY